MATVTELSNLPHCRALFLDTELPDIQYTKAIIEGEVFEAIKPTMTIKGQRVSYNTSVGIVADKDKYPDSFFIGKQIIIA
ncbi:MAG: hypothetical protein RR213_07110 [Raoultibacter sp.]